MLTSCVHFTRVTIIILATSHWKNDSYYHLPQSRKPKLREVQVAEQKRALGSV